MMKRLGLALAVCLSLIGGVLAQGGMGPGPGMVHSTGVGCAQATAFLARTSLAGADVTNYTNLICGLVTDGLITGDMSTTGCGAPFDAIYIFATVDQATALLNLCRSTYNATITGSPTFTAYTGFTGTNTVNNYINSNFNGSTASSPNFVQNSAHISIWNLSNTTASTSDMNTIAATAGTNIFSKLNSDSKIYARLNDNVEPAGFTISDPRGHLFSNRSSSTGRELYQNASTTLSGGTVATFGSSTSKAPINSNVSFVGNGSNGTTKQMAMASIGASLNGTQVTNFYNRLRTYMTAVGVP